MAQIQSIVIDGQRVKIGSKAHQELAGGELPAMSQTLNAVQSRATELANEPAALSSTLGAENFKTNVMPTITGANNNLQQSNQTRTETASASNKDTVISDIPPEVQAEMDALRDPLEVANKALIDSWERQRREAEATAKGLTLAATKAAEANISVLTGQYNERRQLLEESNKQNQASWKQQFLRTGQDEYSPGMTSDFLSQKEREGMKLLTDLDNTYRSNVASINAALEEKKYATAANLTQQLRALEEKMLEQVVKNAEEAKKTNDVLRENMIKSSRENAIGNLINQYGITDPVELQNFLNSDDSGNQIGDVTLDEISKVLKMLGHDPNMTGLTADYKTYSAMKKSGELNDSWTYTDFLVATSAAKRAPAKGKSSSSSSVSSSKGDLLTYEQWYPAFLKTAEGQQLAKQSGGNNVELAQTLRDVYQEASLTYYRDNPSTSKKYTAANIPTPLRENLVADINNGATLADLIAAYPDISSSYISSTRNALTKKETGSNSSTLSDEDFLNALRGN